MDISKLKAAPGRQLKLKNFDPAGTHGVSKAHARKALPAHVEKLAALQDLLYAGHKRSLLMCRKNLRIWTLFSVNISSKALIWP